MKSILFYLFALGFFIPTALQSQATAGYVPPGASVNFTPVELSIIENEHDTTTYLDLDGDGEEDVRIWLLKGYPPTDAPNMVVFFALDNTFTFCNGAGSPENLALYQFGDALCTNDENWGTDSIYTVGCYGGWNCIQDGSPVIDKYVAYKKNSSGEIGWIKISMSLFSGQDPIPVTFNISEMLVLHIGTGIHDKEESEIFNVLPNPTSDGRFVIENVNAISDIEIFNALGQCIERHTWNENQFQLPDQKGIYMIRLRDMNGKYSIRKIVRL
ncbi:MAG TPA: T9SS type A sorting domain-containing protein [Saprospiraceae bacterium]|nr:T9SS type A sorting domain-containing protein [Saprospiraceae bacterium]